MKSRARSSSAAGALPAGTFSSSRKLLPTSGTSARPTSVSPSRPQANAGRRPVDSPAAATSSGEGVSPAASAASSGSLPVSIAATTSGDAGLRRGSFSRQPRIARSTAGSSPATSADGSIGRSSRCLRVYSTSDLPSKARRPV